MSTLRRGDNNENSMLDVAHSVMLAHARLFQCEACDAFWEELEREARQITRDVAEQYFPRNDEQA